MFNADQYQLLDFGNGRRLERFGTILLDRPCPAAEHVTPENPGAWDFADARYEESGPDRGNWLAATELPERWTVAHGNLHFELKRTPQGQVGLFPEQAENWDWLIKNVEGRESKVESRDMKSTLDPRPSTLDSPPLKILNLFAYTGGSTLAAAAAGAEVTHVDAAKNIVAWARRNAELSGLSDQPIRWIVEDAVKFCKRELRRGNGYDAVILDPPSYGHGPHGEVWRLTQHLSRLLELCAQLTAGRRRFVLLTCHTPGYNPERLAEMVGEHFADESNVTLKVHPLRLRSSTGRELPAGVAGRWLRNPPRP
ncbi:MAG: class I SAM-dependent methyltransferase [Pirellulales bacterium]|nr:class I SAM-dependent methyltransferase [Pirellulales bacterium]